MIEVLIFDLEEIVDVGVLIDKEIRLEVSPDFDAAVARYQYQYGVDYYRECAALLRDEFRSAYIPEEAFTSRCDYKLIFLRLRSRLMRLHLFACYILVDLIDAFGLWVLIN